VCSSVEGAWRAVVQQLRKYRVFTSHSSQVRQAAGRRQQAAGSRPQAAPALHAQSFTRAVLPAAVDAQCDSH
jgi:hypothetical protein